MSRRIGSQRMRTERHRTYLRQWREYRKLTLDRAASRLGMSAAQLSRIETGKSPYSQDFLELAADAYGTDAASLLMRDPSDEEAIWSLWERAKPGERALIADIAKRVLRTGT
jgi:transcriptional regulator with XRE-family HTH domain